MKKLTFAAVAITSLSLFVLAGEGPAPTVFTASQAEAGRVAAMNSCAQCHTPSLKGRVGDPSENPPLDSLPDDFQKFVSNPARGIQARAPSSNPTRDQYRLMMQDLLAKRFKLAVHWETRQLQVFGLTPAKVGKLGPQVRVHSDEPPCSDVAGELPGSGEGKSTSDRIPGGFPAICRQLVRLQPCPSGHDCWGARNLPLGVLAPSLLSYFERSLTNGHPIVDRTALSGNYDFFFDFGDDEGQPKGSGRTLLEALKEQLGLKLESQAAPVDVLVIDHVEEPSPN